MLPSHDNLIILGSQIQLAVEQIARQIRQDYYGRQIILLGILDGAFMFLPDLARRLTALDVIVKTCKISSYKGTAPAPELILEYMPTLPAGLPVIIVDDLMDTGRTLHFLLGTLLSRGFTDVATCVLFTKDKLDPVVEYDVPIDYDGLAVPDVFIYGYGLDLDGGMRHLPDVYIFKPVPTEPPVVYKTLLEIRAAEAKANTNPDLKYCPECFTRFSRGFIHDGKEGWYNYEAHVSNHGVMSPEHLWSEACPFEDGQNFHVVADFIDHLAEAHGYKVTL